MGDKNIIKFNEPFIAGLELEYINDVFQRGRFYGSGKYTELCEKKISDLLDAEVCYLTDSCTSALEMVALALRDWNKKQEVIMPSYTFSSTAAAFLRAGFDVVFAEIDPRTMMLDPADISHRISEHTVAVVAVHYGGWIASVEEIRSICDGNGLFMIEDAAQAFGCARNDRLVGSVGDFACFSFHETKNLHAGLAGCLVVNDLRFVDKLRHIWERGTNRQEMLRGLVDKYSWVEIGGSFYPTELQAAFLYAQLEQYEQNLKHRHLIFEVYRKGLEAIRSDEYYFPVTSQCDQLNWHAFWLRFSSAEHCEYVRIGLLNENVHAFIGYVPLHSSPVGIKLGNAPSDLPVTEELASRVLRLPLHNEMVVADAEKVVKALYDLKEQYEKF